MFNTLLTATTASTGGWLSYLPTLGLIVLLVVVFYFMMIRPQKKREKEENDMRNNLSVGDEITTIGGIVGRILSVSDETVVIGTSGDCTKMRILKSAVSRVDKKLGEPEKTEEDKK